MGGKKLKKKKQKKQEHLINPFFKTLRNKKTADLSAVFVI